MPLKGREDEAPFDSNAEECGSLEQERVGDEQYAYFPSLLSYEQSFKLLEELRGMRGAVCNVTVMVTVTVV